ncbi:MAG: AMIN domain-containing protein, partial [Deltaproteobacteria bacterium]
MRQACRVKLKWIFQLGLLVLVFCALGCATPTSAPSTPEDVAEESVSPESRQLTDIQVVDQDGSLEIVLVGSDSMSYTAFKAIDPLRLVVDLPDTVGQDVPSPLAVENEVIGKIETFIVSQGPRPMTRV